MVRHQALPARAQVWKVSLLATIFLLSVVLGNVSLRFIPVSFAQAGCRLLSPAILCVSTHALLLLVQSEVVASAPYVLVHAGHRQPTMLHAYGHLQLQ